MKIVSNLSLAEEATSKKLQYVNNKANDLTNSFFECKGKLTIHEDRFKRQSSDTQALKGKSSTFLDTSLGKENATSAPRKSLPRPTPVRAPRKKKRHVLKNEIKPLAMFNSAMRTAIAVGNTTAISRYLDCKECDECKKDAATREGDCEVEEDDEEDMVPPRSRGAVSVDETSGEDSTAITNETMYKALPLKTNEAIEKYKALPFDALFDYLYDQQQAGESPLTPNPSQQKFHASSMPPLLQRLQHGLLEPLAPPRPKSPRRVLLERPIENGRHVLMRKEFSFSIPKAPPELCIPPTPRLKTAQLVSPTPTSLRQPGLGMLPTYSPPESEGQASLTESDRHSSRPSQKRKLGSTSLEKDDYNRETLTGQASDRLASLALAQLPRDVSVPAESSSGGTEAEDKTKSPRVPDDKVQLGAASEGKSQPGGPVMPVTSESEDTDASPEDHGSLTTGDAKIHRSTRL